MLTVSLLFCAMMALARADGNSTEPSCPENWTRFNGRCFVYVPSRTTWADAGKHCQTVGGNLASVHSFAEQLAIQSMIQFHGAGFPETWLGGYDATQEGTWFWSDGTPFDYTYWAAGEPDNYNNADCLVMNYGDKERFGDQPCDHTKPFVCAKNV